jgi:hypothetical protein
MVSPIATPSLQALRGAFDPYCLVMFQVRFIVPLSFPAGQWEIYVPGMLIVSAVPFFVPAPA